ncbi:hypothetical protein A5893_08865 [Pedobacter psychrophilus]|uniref:Methyltransferase FkbM domain-containing protein n=1 Tax=Pedobacter psychrophilus TaxID=1826909 RepID=A0A179DF50_9SPHI|nr:hypothetical protein [Pedobacter psychrophilus]OAQ39685.1 hypothetical protein A5893_08865 [Pedobacter psychrophilus]
MIKKILKDKFLILKIRNRFNPNVQISQRQLFHYYQDKVKQKDVPSIIDTGFRVFSHQEEDGKLLFIFSTIGMGNKTFIEIGSDDGVNSNAANLIFNFGWHGLFIDGNKNSIKRGINFFKKYPTPFAHPPKFVLSKVTAENINETIENAGFKKDIDFLSIDIDGNDYWIWNALSIINPKVVIIETHIEFGYNDIIVPYDANYSYPGKHPVYHGASPTAMQKLGKKKGYRLVGGNELGYNFIFIRNGIADDLIPEVSVKSLISHPSAIESFKKFESIRDWAYIKPIDE